MQTFSIFKKELNSSFSSLVAYIVIVIFLVITGLFTWVFPQTNVIDSGFSNIDTLFTLAPYIYLFLIPAITMRVFAEEKTAGTMEFLLTKPLTDWQIILGKFFASYLLVFFALLPTFIYYYSVSELGAPQGNIDSGAVFGSYIGLILLGGVFTSIGLFSSVITSNQIVAFILSVFLSFFLYEGFASVANIQALSGISYSFSQLGIDYHYSAISRGLVDSRNLIYFFGLIALMLSATKLVLGSRKW
ncbi:MAG: ABC-2 type transport system permease protein [Bacteroidia bacterium]|jgi:ABC-2 type transport system permease protein